MANQCQDVVKCGFCPKPASFSCQSNAYDLCEDCLAGLARPPSKTGHDVVELAKKNEDNSYFCESHQDQLCSKFCTTCDLPICNQCVSNEHNSHNLSKLSEENEEVKKKRFFIKLCFFIFVFILPLILFGVFFENLKGTIGNQVTPSLDESINTGFCGVDECKNGTQILRSDKKFLTDSDSGKKC